MWCCSACFPLLVYDAAVTSSPTAFFRNARSIGVLAVPLVVATAFGVAAVAHWLGHLSWPMAFVLGTAVGPTDAAAATSIARRLGLPRRLVTDPGRRGAVQRRHGAGALRRGRGRRHHRALLGHPHGGLDRVLDGGRGRPSAWPSGSPAAGCATGSTIRRSRSPARSCWPTPLTCRPRRSTRRACWPRSRRPVPGLAQQRRSVLGPEPAAVRRLLGRPWCSWSTPPCSCWWDLSFHTFSSASTRPGRAAGADRDRRRVDRHRGAPGLDGAFGWLIRPRRRGRAVHRPGRDGANG